MHHDLQTLRRPRWYTVPGCARSLPLPRGASTQSDTEADAFVLGRRPSFRRNSFGAGLCLTTKHLLYSRPTKDHFWAGDCERGAHPHRGSTHLSMQRWHPHQGLHQFSPRKLRDFSGPDEALMCHSWVTAKVVWISELLPLCGGL